MALQSISVGSGSKLNIKLLLALLALAASSYIPSAAASRRRPSTLTYYVHATQDISTAYITQPVNPVATGTFGQAGIFSYKVTLQPDINSTKVGSIRGFEAFDSIDPSDPSVLVLNTLTYDDGVYAGTISLHGQADFNLTSYNVTVVGGTAHFVGVRGYAAITNLQTPGSDRVFQHVLHLL